MLQHADITPRFLAIELSEIARPEEFEADQRIRNVHRPRGVVFLQDSGNADAYAR